MTGYRGAAHSRTTPSPEEMFCIWSWAIHGIKSFFAKCLCLIPPCEEKDVMFQINQPAPLCWRTVSERGAAQRPSHQKLFILVNTLETAQVIFQAPQHSVSVKLLGCWGEEDQSPGPRSHRQDSWGCPGSWVCSWELWSPTSACGSYAGAVDPQCLPGFLPVTLATRHGSRGI